MCHRVLISFVVLMLLSFVPGCGSGGGGDSSAPIVPGSVSPLIGGAGLRAVTGAGDDFALTADRRFELPVSALGPQLLLVVDAADEIRGMALHVPSAGASEIRVDPASTALAAVFLCPGIMTGEDALAGDVVAAIESLTSLGALEALLTTSLPTASYESLIGSTLLADAVAACVAEFAGANSPLVAERSGATGLLLTHLLGATSAAAEDARDGTEEAGGVRVTASASAMPDELNLNAANGGWRRVALYRRDLVGGVEVLAEQMAFPVEGAIPVTAGTLFNGTFGMPGETVSGSLSTSVDVGQVWVVGPGLGASADVLPPSLRQLHGAGAFSERDLRLALGSLVDYIVFPAISLILARRQVIDVATVFDELLSAILSGNAIGTKLADLFTLTSPQDWAAALVDLAVEMVSLFAGLAPASLLNNLLVLFSVTLAAGNGGVAAGYFLTAPPVSRIDIVPEVPTALIEEPTGGSTFQGGQPVNFVGSGTTAAGDPVSPSALTWSSDLQGPLGVGAQFTRNDLLPGTHVITLAVIVGGIEGTASVSITVQGTPGGGILDGAYVGTYNLTVPPLFGCSTINDTGPMSMTLTESSGVVTGSSVIENLTVVFIDPIAMTCTVQGTANGSGPLSGTLVGQSFIGTISLSDPISGLVAPFDFTGSVSPDGSTINGSFDLFNSSFSLLRQP